MFSEEKVNQCKQLANDFKDSGSHDLGSAYCKMCQGGLDKDRICNGSIPRCSNEHGPLDGNRCKMIPFGWSSYKDTLLLPKACSDRNRYNCRLDGDNCMLVGKNKDTCADNVAKLFSDPTKDTASLKYPDYNPTCRTRNGDILPYYDKDGKPTGQCTFVTDYLDKDVKLIPNEGYKRKEMDDCTMFDPINNPTGTTTYTYGSRGHPVNKWNPKIVDGPPFCNSVVKSKVGKSPSGSDVRNPLIPIQYYQDPTDSAGKVFIREPFTNMRPIKKVKPTSSQRKVIYWDPHGNSTYIN